LPISLDCPFLVAPSVFSNVCFSCLCSVVVKCVILYLFLFPFVVFMPLSMMLPFDSIVPMVWYVVFLFFHGYWTLLAM